MPNAPDSSTFGSMRKLNLLSLRRSAEHHVERHPASAARLREVLERKVKAHAQRTGEPIPDEVAGFVTTIVEDLVRLGVVDDRRLAEARSRSMRNRGKSLRAVEASLRTKRIAPDVVAQVTREPLDELGEKISPRTADQVAARTLVRKKKLGGFRPESERAENRQRDLAVLARAGFSFELARRALDEPVEDELHDGAPWASHAGRRGTTQD